MRIAYVSAGAAGMYCGSCIHDNTLAAALQKLGHEVALLPTYTPLRTDEPSVSEDRIFFGALGVYLRHRYGWYRRAPAFLRHGLDRPWLIRGLTSFAPSTDPGALGALTLSMLEGERGPHREELERLITWLRDRFQPDVVHLTNSLFLGLARRIREELGVPVVVGLQGEDHFIAGLGDAARTAAVREMRRRVGDASAFVAPSRAYARSMTGLLGVAEERIRVVPFGILLEGHGTGIRQPRPSDELAIGYLARICPDKGLHLLAESFCRLASTHDASRLRLRAAGYLARTDRPYLRSVLRLLDRAGLGGRFEYVGELDRPGKMRFLSSLDLFSVPALAPEAKGLPALEAMAQGVPVVLPENGTLTELVQTTGGGILVDGGSAGALAEGLRHLIDRPGDRESMGLRGRQAVRRLYGSERMGEAMARLFHAVVSGGTGREPGVAVDSRATVDQGALADGTADLAGSEAGALPAPRP